MRMRMRDEVRRRPSLQGLIGDEELLWQAGSKLHATMRRIAEGASLGIVSETHLRKSDAAMTGRMRKLLTSGEFERWQLIEAHAPDDSDKHAGLVVWYYTTAMECT